MKSKEKDREIADIERERELERKSKLCVYMHIYIYIYVVHMHSPIRVVLGLQVGLLRSQVKLVGPHVQYMWVPRPTIIPTIWISKN